MLFPWPPSPASDHSQWECSPASACTPRSRAAPRAPSLLARVQRSKKSRWWSGGLEHSCQKPIASETSPRAPLSLSVPCDPSPSHVFRILRTDSMHFSPRPSISAGICLVRATTSECSWHRRAGAQSAGPHGSEQGTTDLYPVRPSDGRGRPFDGRHDQRCSRAAASSASMAATNSCLLACQASSVYSVRQ